MSGIKYYQLTKGEELPDEFCAVRDIDGEPSEYTFYVPEAENVKLRELLQASLRDFRRIYDYDEQDGWQMVDAIDRMVIRESIADRMRELGVEVS